MLLSPLHELNIPEVSISPIIDGDIDSVWRYADSTTTSIQWNPDEGEAPTESTKVYICCDDKNIYVAFKCFDSVPDKIDAKMVARDCYVNGDCVWITLDTFGDRTTAYEFGVNVLGIQSDDKLSQDGRNTDATWDGVWYSAAKITDYGYNIEMKIPFKTLRFKSGLSEWGANFFRYISRENECDTWAPLKQAEGMRVSRCGTLKRIHPKSTGLHLEVYPVGLARYETESVHPRAGLDLAWGLTPSSQLSLTAYPDFAQIEADPYTMNLSKYETYLQEKRPFFVEGREIFNTPIRLFYSRRIGNDQMSTEPKSLYSVGRVKIGMLKNSDLGILYSETRDEDNTQEVLGIDGTFRTQELQLSSQIAGTDSGYAEIVNLNWSAPKFVVASGYKHFDESFDIKGIGYAPWKGLTKYYVNAGPQFYNVGPFQRLATSVDVGREKEADEPWGYWISGLFSFDLKSSWGFFSNFSKGTSHEMNKDYEYYLSSIGFWSDNRKSFGTAGDAWYKSYDFNYKRGYFASMGTSGLCSYWKVIPPLTLSLDISNTVEWKPDGEIEEISWIWRPTLHYAITKDMRIRVYAEPNTDTHIHQFNALFSYNFRPKSWFYLAFNQTIDDAGAEMVFSDRIAVVKIRYLFFW
jgi:uncharacterized protein (DUF2164 family)